jgi:hypothetical protein
MNKLQNVHIAEHVCENQTFEGCDYGQQDLTIYPAVGHLNPSYAINSSNYNTITRFIYRNPTCK